MIVVGSPNSSNSNRLREVAANRGARAYMVDRADELDPRGSPARARRRHRGRVGAGGAGAGGARAPARARRGDVRELTAWPSAWSFRCRRDSPEARRRRCPAAARPALRCPGIEPRHRPGAGQRRRARRSARRERSDSSSAANAAAASAVATQRRPHAARFRSARGRCLRRSRQAAGTGRPAASGATPRATPGHTAASGSAFSASQDPPGRSGASSSSQSSSSSTSAATSATRAPLPAGAVRIGARRIGQRGSVPGQPTATYS